MKALSNECKLQKFLIITMLSSGMLQKKIHTIELSSTIEGYFRWYPPGGGLFIIRESELHQRINHH